MIQENTEQKESIHITIDGKDVTAYPGETYLTAMRRVGIDVPTLCHEKDLVPSGSCRLCVVEIEGSNRLLPSCSTPVQKGAVVYTNSSRVREARTTLIDLIVQSHPLDCMVCDKQGNCTLQKLAYEYLPVENSTNTSVQSVNTRSKLMNSSGLTLIIVSSAGNAFKSLKNSSYVAFFPWLIGVLTSFLQQDLIVPLKKQDAWHAEIA